MDNPTAETHPTIVSHPLGKAHILAGVETCTKLMAAGTQGGGYGKPKLGDSGVSIAEVEAIRETLYALLEVRPLAEVGS